MPRGKRRDRVSLVVYQHDWRPGFAAFYANGGIRRGAKAHVAINVGSLLGAVSTGDLPAKDVPYFVAETLFHEFVQVLEEWAGVEFSEDRIEALIEKYRRHYLRGQKRAVWKYTGERPAPAKKRRKGKGR